MTYGPTRSAPHPDFAGRINRLVHLDLVPGLTPMLLREYGVKAQPLGGTAFRQVVELLPSATSEIPTGVAMIVGQYLAALEVLTPAEEASLHEGMLRALVAAGHRQVVFKPHPAAGRSQSHLLAAAAATMDVELTIAHDGDPVETLFRDRRPSLVVGCFSTALSVANRFYDIPVATMGGELVLERLTPYANSNRIPATIADAAYPRLHADGVIAPPPTTDLTALVESVSFLMRPGSHPGLRDATGAYIAEHGPARYFKRRQLEATGLAERSLRGKVRNTAATVAGAKARSDIASIARLKASHARARLSAQAAERLRRGSDE